MGAIALIDRAGCQWDMLPHDLPAKSTVYDQFARRRDDGTWGTIKDAPIAKVRVAAGRDPRPTDGVDRQPDGQDDRAGRRAR